MAVWLFKNFKEMTIDLLPIRQVLASKVLIESITVVAHSQAAIPCTYGNRWSICAKVAHLNDSFQISMNPAEGTILGDLEISLHSWLLPDSCRASWNFPIKGIVTIGNIAKRIVLDRRMHYGFTPAVKRGGRWWLSVSILPILSDRPRTDQFCV